MTRFYYKPARIFLFIKNQRKMSSRSNQRVLTTQSRRRAGKLPTRPPVRSNVKKPRAQISRSDEEPKNQPKQNTRAASPDPLYPELDFNSPSESEDEDPPVKHDPPVKRDPVIRIETNPLHKIWAIQFKRQLDNADFRVIEDYGRFTTSDDKMLAMINMEKPSRAEDLKNRFSKSLISMTPLDRKACVDLLGGTLLSMVLATESGGESGENLSVFNRICPTQSGDTLLTDIQKQEKRGDVFVNRNVSKMRNAFVDRGNFQDKKFSPWFIHAVHPSICSIHKPLI